MKFIFGNVRNSYFLLHLRQTIDENKGEFFSFETDKPFQIRTSFSLNFVL